MKSGFRLGGTVALAAALVSTTLLDVGSAAFAQDAAGSVAAPTNPLLSASLPSAAVLANPAISPAAEFAPAVPPAPVAAAPVAGAGLLGGFASLAAAVAAQPMPGAMDSELHCLAAAIFHEAKGESLAGQLAVGRVVVARAASGRFPGSYCGVVRQPGQFSFVRGGSIPQPAPGSPAWVRAVQVAQVAHHGAWESPVEGALFFHARRVSPGWRLTRMDAVDNHIFYR